MVQLDVSQAMRKCVLCHMRTTKAQISLCIRAVWSAPFIVRCLHVDSVMSLVSVIKISSLMLASVAEQASLRLTWSETPEDTFSYGVAHIYYLPIFHWKYLYFFESLSGTRHFVEWRSSFCRDVRHFVDKTSVILLKRARHFIKMTPGVRWICILLLKNQVVDASLTGS